MVIMPVASSLAQTDHTLGHELVHAFQYNMFLIPDTLKRLSLKNVPLWMIEGMAEYLSIGSVDPHTSILILEPYVAVPLQNGGFRNIQFGLNFVPGWKT